MSTMLPVLDDRDFVFPGPTGLANYRAASGDQPAQLVFPGPGKTQIRVVDAGKNVAVSVDGTFIAAVEDVGMLPEPMREFMVNNYYALLRAAREHRADDVNKALDAFRS